MRTLLGALAVVATFALAGCSDAPVSGSLVNSNFAQPLAGTVTFAYTPFDNGGNPLGGQAETSQFECSQDDAAGNIPGGIPDGSPLQECTPPRTVVTGNITGLPEGAMFEAFLVGADPAAARALGSLTSGAIAYDVAEDLTGMFTALEVRLGTFVYATAGTASGANNVAAAEALADIKVTGTYKGEDLTVTVSGLPEGATYQARLYRPDPTNTEAPLTADQTFTVANGETTFTMPKGQYKLADYTEFHIHVANTMINLYKAGLTPE